MKNVTITMDDEAARWIRLWAAEQDTSVSRLVGDLIRQRMEQHRGYHRAMHEFFSQSPRPLKSAGKYPSREQLHERGPVR